MNILERIKMEVKPVLEKYCEEHGVDYEYARKQLRCYGVDFGLLCVHNPVAPEPDGLANEDATRMLPTLWIKKGKDGVFYIEETEYTSQYLLNK